MTREEEFEAALQAREREEEFERLRAHARFLAANRPDLNKTTRHAIIANARERLRASS